MCIACELGFWSAMEYLSPEARAALDENMRRMACDAPDAEPQPASQPAADERKP